MGGEPVKVGVLTFHRCINYGSYWQARCLVEGLRALGHDAELLDHDDPGIRSAEWRNAYQPQRPARSLKADLKRFGVKTRKFLAAFEQLPESPRFALDRPGDAGAYDAVVIGSDEVWNFRHPWYGSKRIFFGEGLRTGRLISYAASFGNHDADHGIDSFWSDRLARFDFLSVRDENSRRIVQAGTGRDPAMVLDPCLQFPPPAVSSVDEPQPYLAVYGNNFPDWFAAALRDWAQASGRRLVSIGYRNAWADEQRIEAGPDEFSALIAGADAVATNFFHGCVFAIHHRRPFVSAPSAYRFNKIRDLTQSLGAERHVVGPGTPADTYAALLGEPLDPEIERRITALRGQSSAFLATALG
jgi:hypothetical protein